MNAVGWGCLAADGRATRPDVPSFASIAAKRRNYGSAIVLPAPNAILGHLSSVGWETAGMARLVHIKEVVADRVASRHGPRSGNRSAPRNSIFRAHVSVPLSNLER
jgi:hypothetical protein